MLKNLIILVAIIGTYTATHTRETYAQTSKAPLTISADETLEWDRKNLNFTANGNAIAQQDGVSIAAKMLKANYRENETTGDNFDIYQMLAISNVTITSADNKAYCDKAIYDIENEVALMTGKNLRLITPQQSITARDKFEYHTTAGKLVAIGNATIKRPTDTVRADRITAYLTTDANGKRTLDRMVAEGNVIITTATEKLTGTNGTYNARTEKAEITGGVTITRGPNILKGDRATVNLKTQISRIFGGQTNNGRVTGTFYPGSTKKAQ